MRGELVVEDRTKLCYITCIDGFFGQRRNNKNKFSKTNANNCTQPRSSGRLLRRCSIVLSCTQPTRLECLVQFFVSHYVIHALISMRECWFRALEYISSAGIDGHMCITYPQFSGTGKEHFVRQHKVLSAISPTEKFRKKVVIKSF